MNHTRTHARTRSRSGCSLSRDDPTVLVSRAGRQTIVTISLSSVTASEHTRRLLIHSLLNPVTQRPHDTYKQEGVGGGDAGVKAPHIMLLKVLVTASTDLSTKPRDVPWHNFTRKISDPSQALFFLQGVQQFPQLPLCVCRLLRSWANYSPSHLKRSHEEALRFQHSPNLAHQVSLEAFETDKSKCHSSVIVRQFCITQISIIASLRKFCENCLC